MQSFGQIWHHTNKGQLYWMDMERVIGAALAGDQQAIAKLYNAYSHKVLGICYNIVGNRAVAEELAHDAFVLAFSKLDHLRNPERFDAWLSSIAANVALPPIPLHKRKTINTIKTRASAALNSF